MKKTLTLFLMLAPLITLQAQPKPFNVAKNANHFVYASYDYGEHIDTHYTQIEICGGSVYLVTDGDRLPDEYRPGGWSNGPYIQGYSVEDLFVDESKDSITYLTTIFGGETPLVKKGENLASQSTTLNSQFSNREYYRTMGPSPATPVPSTATSWSSMCSPSRPSGTVETSEEAKRRATCRLCPTTVAFPVCWSASGATASASCNW